MRGCSPSRVGIDEEEEDHGDGHEVHVEAEDDAAVIPAPAAADAAQGVCEAGDRGDGGDDEPEVGAVVREAGHDEGEQKAGEDEQVGPEQRGRPQMEDGERHGCFL